MPNIEENKDEILLSYRQIQQVQQYSNEIIDNLPAKALDELLGGYYYDQEGLLNEIYSQVNSVLNLGGSLNSDRLGYLDDLEESMDRTLRKLSYNYFKTTCLPNFNQGWRNLEWGNLVQLYPWSLFLAQRGAGKSFEWVYGFLLWRLYSYDRPDYHQRDSVDNRNRKETLLITNESTLGVTHLAKVIEEINHNDVLKEKLNPTGKELGKTGFATATGSLVKLRSLFSSGIRGNHCGTVIYDDLLDESSLYSKDQRAKAKEIFYGAVTPVVEPGGFLVGAGCVNPNSIIQTDNGLQRIGNISPKSSLKEKDVVDFNYSVYGKNGYQLTSKYWYNGLTDTNKIKTSIGLNLECSQIHPLYKLNENSLIEWKQSEELKVGDYVGVLYNTGIGNGEKIKLSHKKYDVDYPNRVILSHDGFLNKDLAYFMGLWVADGSFSKCKSGFTITKLNKGVRDFVLSGFSNTKFKAVDDIHMNFNSVDMLDIFQQVGMKISTAKDKSIPDKILSSDKETITSFLSGMFDGDGCFSNNFISYSSISENLIDTLQVILLHLGIISYKRNVGIGISKKVVGKHDLFTLSIYGKSVEVFMNTIGFRYSDKGDNFNPDRLNVEIITGVPFQNKLIKQIREENKEILKPRKLKSPVKTNKLVSERIKYKYLKSMYDWFVSYGCKGDSLEKLGVICENENILWLPIESINKGQCYTVDFVIPEGHNFVSNGIISHNTPYASGDLYTDIKNDPNHMVFEYPAIVPQYNNGTLGYKLLAPDRFTYKGLLDIKESLGSAVFSREYLTSPVTDGSSLFPYEILDKCHIGMENIGFANNIESFPVKMKRVICGCDFAISGNIGSDFSVFSVWGIDNNETYYLMYVWRKSGASHNEQVNQIVAIDQRFKPNMIVCENNGFQKIIADLAKQRGLRNIEPFTTTSHNKKNSYDGLPSLAAIMERGQMRMPYKEGTTRDMVEVFRQEFHEISFNEDKGTLEGVGTHDDCPMSTFFAITKLRENTVRFKAHLV